MKAVAVFPGKSNSIHLTDLPEPSVDDIPDGRGVLLEVLRFGVDSTDKEINYAEHGAAPRRLRPPSDRPRAVRACAGGRTQRERPCPRRLRSCDRAASGQQHLRPDRHLRHDHRRDVLRASE